MNTNDQKIMQMKEKIEKKKEELKKSERFSPITNCFIELDGETKNINTLQKEQLIPLLVKLHVYLKSAEELEIVEDYMIRGFHIKDWVADVQARLNYVSRKQEEEKLKKMEKQLHRLLSEEKKVALELEEIEAMLE